MHRNPDRSLLRVTPDGPEDGKAVPRAARVENRPSARRSQRVQEGNEMVVISEEIVEKGWQFTGMLIILLVTGVALVAAYIIMRRGLWPALRRSGYEPD